MKTFMPGVTPGAQEVAVPGPVAKPELAKPPSPTGGEPKPSGPSPEAEALAGKAENSPDPIASIAGTEKSPPSTTADGSAEGGSDGSSAIPPEAGEPGVEPQAEAAAQSRTGEPKNREPGQGQAKADATKKDSEKKDDGLKREDLIPLRIQRRGELRQAKEDLELAKSSGQPQETIDQLEQRVLTIQAEFDGLGKSAEKYLSFEERESQAKLLLKQAKDKRDEAKFNKHLFGWIKLLKKDTDPKNLAKLEAQIKDAKAELNEVQGGLKGKIKRKLIQLLQLLFGEALTIGDITTKEMGQGVAEATGGQRR